MTISPTTEGGIAVTLGKQTIIFTPEECDQLATELVVWRWRTYGDSFDPTAERSRNLRQPTYAQIAADPCKLGR